jgi:hypothetical protein
MSPADLISYFFLLFVLAPVVAAILAFKGPPGVRSLARVVLLFSWLANAAATLACLRYAFARPSSGIGNGVLLLPAIPLAVLALLWFGIWRAARRHAYVQSLPPAERRVEELSDIDRALEAAKSSLARARRRLDRWFIGSEESGRLRDEIGILETSIATLEAERAKRL